MKSLRATLAADNAMARLEMYILAVVVISDNHYRVQRLCCGTACGCCCCNHPRIVARSAFHYVHHLSRQPLFFCEEIKRGG